MSRKTASLGSAKSGLSQILGQAKSSSLKDIKNSFLSKSGSRCCRGMGASFQKRGAPGKGSAERCPLGGRRPSSIHSMEGFSWPFPQEAFRPPNACPYAVCRAPAFSFLKRDPHAPALAMQKKEPVLQLNCHILHFSALLLHS
jgi:hypothetical protein